MIYNIIASLLLLAFVLTLFGGAIEVAYNLKQNKSTDPYVWIVPAIFAALFWFFSHIQ